VAFGLPSLLPPTPHYVGFEGVDLVPHQIDNIVDKS